MNRHRILVLLFAAAFVVSYADNPLGPFKKCPLNPVINSGHETTLFPFKEGIAALVIRDGTEHFTIQYSKDGVNFEIASITELMPEAAGPFVPDAFTNTRYGRGITWGLRHNTWAGQRGKSHSVLMRFDCDLSVDINDPGMKFHHYMHRPEFFYQHGLSEKQRRRALDATKKLKLQSTQSMWPVKPGIYWSKPPSKRRASLRISNRQEHGKTGPFRRIMDPDINRDHFSSSLAPARLQCE